MAPGGTPHPDLPTGFLCPSRRFCFPPSAPGTDFTSRRPRPLTLSISLFFSSPFASFSCWLSLFQASRPRRFRALSSAPDFRGLPAPPAPTLGCSAQPGTIARGTEGQRDHGGGVRQHRAAPLGWAAGLCNPKKHPFPSQVQLKPPQLAEGFLALLSHHLPLGHRDLGQPRGVGAAHAA